MDADGNLLAYRKVPSNACMGGATLMRTIEDVIMCYPRYDAIALSLTGQIDVQKGTVVFAAPRTIPDFTGANVRDPLQEKFNVPVYVENDVNCAAIGEARAGVARGHRQFICVTYGTGIGGAIVLDNEVYHGSHWSAGEIGHMLIHADKEAAVCSCGKHGCYEAYASTAALCRLAEGVLRYPVDGREFFAVFNDGEHSSILRTVFENWCMEICYGLLSVVHAFNPSLIVLGGGVMEEKIVIEKIQQVLPPMLLPSFRNVEIARAALGNCAGIVGAAYLARENLK